MVTTSMDANYRGQYSPYNMSNQGTQIKHNIPDAMASQGPDSDELEYTAKILLSKLSMTTKRIMLVKTCLTTLQASLQQLGPDWRVAPFGSACSGFCTSYSDLDATCYRPDSNTTDNAWATEELRVKLLPLLVQHPRFEVIETIWTARIPILRLKFHGDKRCRGTLEVDLSCHNTEPLANTYLLRAYSKLHPAVRSLVLVIKHWAKMEHVSGAADKNLSSYSITLMVIYFLLVTPGLNVPVVPVHLFMTALEEKGRFPRLDMKWSCQQPLGMLVRGFFYFFAQEFVWGEEVVSVRVGKRLAVGDAEYGNLRGRFDHARLHVEDPYLLSRNLNCALSQQQEFILRNKICWVWQQLQQNCIPHSFCQEPSGAQHAMFETPELAERVSGKPNSSKEATNREDARPEEIHSPSNGHVSKPQKEVKGNVPGSQEVKGISPLPAAKSDKSEQEKKQHLHKEVVHNGDSSGILASSESCQLSQSMTASVPEPEELPIPVTLFMGGQQVIKL